MIRAALPLAALALAGARGARDPLEGRIAGPPQQCIDPQRTGGPDILADGRIIYRQSGARWYVTRAVGRCPALRPMTTLIVELFGGQQCRGDRFRVRAPNDIIPSSVCRFDAFVPYDRIRARTG